MTEQGSIGVQDRPTRLEPKSGPLAKIHELAASDEFVSLPPNLKSAAIEQSAFFVDASDDIVNSKLKSLYDNRDAGFNHHEKQAFGSLTEVNDRYLDLFNLETRVNGISTEEAKALCQRHKKIDVASRVARNEFAKALNYLPGKEGMSGDHDYAATTANPDFIKAEQFVREAVGKFS